MWALQSPSERLDWHIDWTDWMELGDAIYSSNWEIDQVSAGVPIVEDDGIDGFFTSAFLSGLELGKSYQLRNIIQTDAGRIGVRELTIRCDIQE